MLSQWPEAIFLWMYGSLHFTTGSHASGIFFDNSLAQRILGVRPRTNSPSCVPSVQRSIQYLHLPRSKACL